MIYEYQKYKGIAEFVKGSAIDKKGRPFTVLKKCQGCEFINEKPTINNHCFGCLFCVFGDGDLRNQIDAMYGEEFIKSAASSAFSGAPVKPTVAQKGLQHPYTSLEKFTAVDETSNIQPWATGLLHHMCSKDNRISMEVPVFNDGYDRNGRLDICSVTEDHLLIMESKITLKEALKDERFIEQHKKYTEVINEITSNYTYLTLIGGKETDIFPADSQYCTGTVGNEAARFHRILIDNNMQAITANALWCLCCKFLEEGSKFAWDTFLINVFRDPECIGLVSAGKLCSVNGKIDIVSIF